MNPRDVLSYVSRVLVWWYLTTIPSTFPMNLDLKWGELPLDELETSSTLLEKLVGLTSPLHTGLTPPKLDQTGEYIQVRPLHQTEPHSGCFFDWKPKSGILQDSSSDPEPQEASKKHKYDDVRLPGACSTSSPEASRSNNKFIFSSDRIQPAYNQLQSSEESDLYPSLKRRKGHFKEVSESVGATNIAQQVSKTNIMTEHENVKVQRKIKHPACLERKGLIIEPLLQEFFSYFQLKIGLTTYDYSYTSSKNDLPLVVCNYIFTTQQKRHIILNYQLLIGWIYELHEKVLNHFNIPIHTYKKHHRKFFEWLQNQILFPSGNVENQFFDAIWRSYMGSDSAPLNSLLGTSREILIRYFSIKEHRSENVVKSASDLLASYFSQNKVDYSSVSHFSGNIQEPQSMEMIPKFQQTFSFISKMNLEEYIFEKRKVELKSINPNVSPLIPCLLYFRAEYDRVGRVVGRFQRKAAFNRTYHPKFPISLTFQTKTNGWGCLRILKEEKSIIPESIIKYKFDNLAKVLDRIYIQFLKESGGSIEDLQKMRENILNWLARLVFNPTHSIPILGVVPVDASIAPWDKEASNNSFGYIQVRLMEYLSAAQTSQSLRRISTYLISTWESINQKTKPHTE
ncbi:hypothetical protein PGT21_028377 [Puccinia graminis f. sp. tritici]|uniref:Uncharacterized protein n=1 Tax=Puccinia graminis f. sp. tritici TaxID=56615 RepID=A0A5B0P9T3_PUCGR|nr:hypothetical protein PGT21_028377 [Puccinia graminis f. sp. tritici]KAA1116930.1 hypothetical protein PGTUg99_031236 [Puccinia graminis f. sp. tritici]